MTSATPKPRTGEHTFTDVAVAHAKELAALRERERELVEALKAVVEWVVLNKPRTYPSGDWGAYPPDCIEQARALLAKVPT